MLLDTAGIAPNESGYEPTALLGLLGLEEALMVDRRERVRAFWFALYGLDRLPEDKLEKTPVLVDLFRYVASRVLPINPGGKRIPENAEYEAMVLALYLAFGS